jgi:hypothetical protein
MSPGPRDDRGQALLLLLAIAAILIPLSAGFVSAMHLQDRLSGDRLRAATAFYLAEAGVEKVLWYLDAEAPDGSRDGSWRPAGYAEELRDGGLPGRFLLDIRDENEGRVSIVSWGEVGRVRRGVRVVAKVAPGALEYALFGAGLLAVDGDQAVLSLEEVRDHCLRALMVASNQEIWFRTPGSRVEFNPCGQNPAVLLIGLPDPLRLTVGDVHGAARYGGLKELGVQAGRVETRVVSPEATPDIDTRALRRRAERNQANDALNRSAGEAAGRPSLRDKQNSLYTSEEFAILIRSLREKDALLVGPVYVAGGALVPADPSLTIAEGFLAAEGPLTVEPGARLTIRHSPRSAFLPALVAIGSQAPLVVGEGAKVEVEGVIAAQGLIDVREAAAVRVVGAVMALAPESSLRLNNARLSIQYEPTVPGTVGFLARGGRRRLFQLAWHEIR